MSESKKNKSKKSIGLETVLRWTIKADGGKNGLIARQVAEVSSGMRGELIPS